MIHPFNCLLKLSIHLLPLFLLVLFPFLSLLLLVYIPTPLYLLARLPLFLQPLLLMNPLPIRVVCTEPIKKPLPWSPVKVKCKIRSMNSQTKSLFSLIVSHKIPPQHLSLLMYDPAAKTISSYCVSTANKGLISQLGLLCSSRTPKPIGPPMKKELDMCSSAAHVFCICLAPCLRSGSISRL